MTATPSTNAARPARRDRYAARDYAAAAGSRRRLWTALGLRMGFTSRPVQRENILAAVDQMTWLDTEPGRRQLAGAAARRVLNSVVRRRLAAPRRVGVAQMDSGPRLLGVEDAAGTRCYVLDLGSEAAYVLAELKDHRRGSNAEVRGS